ncbi:MAG: hypothetical protein Q8M24_24115 [Pseudolabrys sp.]|nr:hypothetical protein [Pseudolabrys sp.]MDP2298536.1 hypothetical protein [Pseudolabrys sp.]
MTAFPNSWAHIHPSVFHNTAGPLRVAEATPRPSGALRYRCPVNGSLVLVTDEAMLTRIDAAPFRLRCGDCGEMHLLMQDNEADGGAAIPPLRAIVGGSSPL